MSKTEGKAMKHPLFSEIVDFVEHKLNAADSKRIQNHLAGGCSSCENTREWLSRNLDLLKSEPVLYDAPEYLIQKAVDTFPEKRAKIAEWIKAHLQYDSWSLPQSEGFRSAGQGPRQWIYFTRSYKIHLMLDQTTQGQQIVGQLTTNNPDADVAGCLVELMQKNKRVDSVYTNRNGEFLLSSVPAEFELKIHGYPESFVVSMT
jgi:hypothetical protein